MTEPGRLARWIGTWAGDPASGHVAFTMTAEGAPAEQMEIRECDPPRRLAVTSHVGEERWLLDLDLVEADGVTTCLEYYLDRLVAAETGADVEAIDFDRDYYPAMREHYRAEAN